ncbi:MAG TPA: Dyp-type peroxidase [Chloroflexota bacterium]
MEAQPGILQPPPPVGRHLTFDVRHGGDARAALGRRAASAPASCVVGLGAPLVMALGASIDGLRPFPALPGCGVEPPSTQNALWVFVREQSASECFDASRGIERSLGSDMTAVEEVGTFLYRGGHDLSGYEDGTENPRGEHAAEVGIVGSGPLQGSSFAATQRWIHDLIRFQDLTQLDRDNTIGRHLEGNDEIPDAPVTAHIQRSAQESFEPDAFMVRRSMPWSEQGQHGLYFLAFGNSLDRFERVLARMAGMDDGVVDGLFGFTRPVTGGYYWCPPRSGDRLDLSAVGIQPAR